MQWSRSRPLSSVSGFNLWVLLIRVPAPFCLQLVRWRRRPRCCHRSCRGRETPRSAARYEPRFEPRVCLHWRRSTPAGAANSSWGSHRGKIKWLKSYNTILRKEISKFPLRFSCTTWLLLYRNAGSLDNFRRVDTEILMPVCFLTSLKTSPLKNAAQRLLFHI